MRSLIGRVTANTATEYGLLPGDFILCLVGEHNESPCDVLPALSCVPGAAG